MKCSYSVKYNSRLPVEEMYEFGWRVIQMPTKIPDGP